MCKVVAHLDIMLVGQLARVEDIAKGVVDIQGLDCSQAGNSEIGGIRREAQDHARTRGIQIPKTFIQPL